MPRPQMPSRSPGFSRTVRYGTSGICQFRRQQKAAETARVGLCASVYSIQGVVSEGARRYLAVEHRKDRGDPDAPPLPRGLPTKGFLPVLDRSGVDIGDLYSRGC